MDVYSGAATDPKRPLAIATNPHLYRLESTMIVSHTARQIGLILTAVLLSACAQDDSQRPEWPPQTGALLEAWKAHQDDIKTLRDMAADKRFAAVALFGDNVHVTAEDYSQVANEDLENSDQWVNLMKRANIRGVAYVNGILGFVVKPPKTGNDRTEAINYVYRHPLRAKQCADEFRDISCGICDVYLDDEWSIRYTWSSGAFEEEYSENFAKVYQDKDSKLSIDEVRSKYGESKRACVQSGLVKMRYENPEDFYSSDR